MSYKRTFALTVAIVGVLFLTTGVGTVAAQNAPDCSTVTYNGDGTETNPYEVGNVDELQCINEQDLDANYTQVSDIDASGTASWNGGNGFDPIGGQIDPIATPFTGTYDGQRFNITDLTIDRTEPSVGLFGSVVDGGEVTNVSAVDADIAGTSGVGGIAAVNGGTISESFVSGSIGDTNSGIVGGLVAENGVEGTIEESYSTASIEGAGAVGGLAGGNQGTVEKSYARGSVDGDTTVAGLVGGNGGTIEESYATGSVSVTALPVGGLVAVNPGTVSDSYWDTQATGRPSTAGGTGLTTSQMTGTAATSNMGGFDFTETWETVSGDYPILAWQQESDGGDGGDDSGASVDDIQTSLSDTDGDDVPDRVEIDVNVSDAARTVIELGESNFEVDASPTDDTQGSLFNELDPDGDGPPEGVQIDEIGGASTTYTVIADLSGQQDGETGTVDVNVDQGADTASETYTVEESTGPLSPNNPFGDANGDPVGVSDAADVLFEWNQNNGTVDGVNISLSDMADFLFGWNQARS